MGDTPTSNFGDRLPQFLPKSPPMDVIKVLLGGERISRGKLIDHLVKFFMVSLHDCAKLQYKMCDQCYPDRSHRAGGYII